MKELSWEQIELVEAKLTQKGVDLLSLKTDLLDHICCEIEHKLEYGKSFHNAFDEAFLAFGEQGLLRIQLETEALLNQKENPMKTTTFISGIIAAALITIGSYFKTQHWLGANVMILFGIICLITVFVPSIFIFEYKKEFSKTGKVAQVIGMLSLIIFIAGLLFRFLHWNWGNSLMYGGAGIAILIYLPMLIYKNSFEKITLARNRNIIVIFALSIAGVFFMSLKGSSLSAVDAYSQTLQNNEHTLKSLIVIEQNLLYKKQDTIQLNKENIAAFNLLDSLKTRLISMGSTITETEIKQLQQSNGNIENYLIHKEASHKNILDDLGANCKDVLYNSLNKTGIFGLNLQNKEEWLSMHFEEKSFIKTYIYLSSLQIEIKESEIKLLTSM